MDMTPEDPIAEALARNNLKPSDFAPPPKATKPDRYVHVSKRVGFNTDGQATIQKKGVTVQRPRDLFDTKVCKLSKRQARKLRKASQRQLREPMALGFKS